MNSTNLKTFDFLENNAREQSSLNELCKDVGSGNFSKGLIFLELLSFAQKRKNTGLLKLLESCTSIKLRKNLRTEISNKQKIKFILQCLSCGTIEYNLESQDKDKYITFNKVMIDIYENVRAGKFERRSYLHLLSYIKRLALTIKYNNKRNSE